MAKGYVKGPKEIEIENRLSIQSLFDNVIVPEIPSYYTVYPVDFENSPVACCPLHDEDTPSFRYYPETRSFYCFGCGAGGNVITLFRRFYNRFFDADISYREAIDYLYTRFIVGKDLPLLQQEKVVEKSQNKPADVIRLNHLRTHIEELISFDKSVNQDVKEQIWELLDNVDCLLSLNKLDAVDAIQYIKDEVIRITGIVALVN